MNDWRESYVPLKSFFSVAQAADLLHRHAHTVRMWIEEGKLDAIKLPGGGIRIHRSGIIKALGAYGSFAPRRRRVIHPGISLTRVRR